jgi:hypothetical protein
MGKDSEMKILLDLMEKMLEEIKEARKAQKK